MLKNKSIGCDIVAALGIAIICGTAQAQPSAPGSTVQLYGTIDLAFGQQSSQPPGPPNAPIRRVSAVHNGGVQTSYLGFRGSEDLGGGLKANFQMESFFRADTGASGRFGPAPAQDPLFSRSSWLGLQGGFGDIKLGNSSNPAWLAMIFTSAMGSNSTFSPSFRQQYNGATRANNGLDTTLSNSIVYTTPRLGGVVGTVAYQSKQASLGSNNFVASLVYRDGPMVMAIAATKVGHAASPSTPGLLDQNLLLLGGSYDLKVVKVFGQYSTLDNDLAKRKHKMPHIGLTAPLGNGEFQMAWAKDDVSGSTNSSRKTLSLGYIYNLSKRSSLYGMAASDKVTVGTAKSYVVGMRHTF